MLTTKLFCFTAALVSGIFRKNEVGIVWEPAVNDDIEMDDMDFDDVSPRADDRSDGADSADRSDAQRSREFTERRRKVEERLEIWRLKDELGLYDDDRYF